MPMVWSINASATESATLCGSFKPQQKLQYNLACHCPVTAVQPVYCPATTVQPELSGHSSTACELSGHNNTACELSGHNNTAYEVSGLNNTACELSGHNNTAYEVSGHNSDWNHLFFGLSLCANNGVFIWSDTQFRVWSE